MQRPAPAQRIGQRQHGMPDPAMAEQAAHFVSGHRSGHQSFPFFRRPLHPAPMAQASPHETK